MKDQVVTSTCETINPKSSSESLKQPSEEELNGLTELRSLVDSSVKLKRYNLSDSILLKFLRSRNSVKEACGLLKSYFGHITSKLDLFSWDDQVADVIQSLIYYPYQNRGPNGEVIIGMEIGKWDYGKIKFETIIQASLFIQEFLLHEEESCQRSGFIFLVDMRNVSLRHIYQMGVTNAMLLATLTDHCMPIKPINIHICFENRFTSLAYSMFRPFLSEELKRRVVFHGNDMTTLFKYLPADYVPPNWDGANEEPKLTEIVEKIKNESNQIVKTWDTYRSQN